MKNRRVEETGSLAAANLTVAQAQRYLELNGIDWTAGYIRSLVFFGKIKSQKIMNSRAIDRSDLDRIIMEHKSK